MVAVLAQLKDQEILFNSRHKVFYTSRCVSNRISSDHSVKHRGDMWGNLTILNTFGAILNVSSQLIGATFFITLLLLIFLFCL